MSEINDDSIIREEHTEIMRRFGPTRYLTCRGCGTVVPSYAKGRRGNCVKCGADFFVEASDVYAGPTESMVCTWCEHEQDVPPTASYALCNRCGETWHIDEPPRP